MTRTSMLLWAITAGVTTFLLLVGWVVCAALFLGLGGADLGSSIVFLSLFGIPLSIGAGHGAYALCKALDEAQHHDKCELDRRAEEARQLYQQMMREEGKR